MYELIILIFDICRFKKAPQDLPYSSSLLLLLVLISTGLNVLMLSIHTDWTKALLQTGLGLFLIIGFSWIMLCVAGKLARFNQTTCAFLGVDALLNLFALPAVATMSLGQGELLVIFVMLGLMIWNWAITGHIVSHALEKSLSFGLGLAFLYLFVSYQVMASLFSEVTGT